MPDATPGLPHGAVTVSLARWRAEREKLLRRDAPVGVRLAPGDDVAELAADLPHLALVAIEFPSLAEGRGYSQARLLRERFGYSGELRAVGDVQRDQLDFMQRCGFDAFELRPDRDIHAALEAFDELSVRYQ